MKLVILGNSGSGKTTMAKQLQAQGAIAYLSLDDIAWNPNVERKPLADSVALLTDFMTQHDQWIIEGCYGDLIAAVLPYCEELRFLNPGVEACLTHCQQRPWEPDKFSTPAEQDAMLANLLDWVRTYDTRADEFGLARHRQIFATFPGNKREYRQVADYDA